MTNKELKNILNRYPDELDVFVNGSDLVKVVMTETCEQFDIRKGKIYLISASFRKSNDLKSNSIYNKEWILYLLSITYDY